MEDSGNDFQPSKKRAAGVELSRENPGLEKGEETSEQEGGTFKRASDDVLASRRIVKVRRQPSSSLILADSAPPTASNPFAAISFAPSAESAPPVVVETVTSEETEKINESDAKSECVVDELRTEPVAEGDKSDAVVDETTTKSVVEEVAEGEKLDVANKTAETDLATEEEPNDNEKDKEERTTEERANDKEIDKEKTTTEEKGNDEEKDKEETNTEDNAQTASFSSFQQLSSGQNAFSGFAGIGSSTPAFSFGSIPKDGSTTGSQQGFGLGASKNGNSSIFGGTGASTQNEGSKFSSMKEVLQETGEENEKAVFMANSVLFEYVDELWKERGKGELKVNVSTTETANARLVMWARGNYRLILNASLFPDMKLTDMDKKGVTFTCMNSASEGKDGFSTFALKFKDASSADEFKASVMEHKPKPSALNNPENSPKATEE